MHEQESSLHTFQRKGKRRSVVQVALLDLHSPLCECTNGPASIVKIMLALGYPLYVMKILGFAKILGGIAILTGKLPRMKEWAYAGFTFDFLGATASHVLIGDAAHALLPLVFFLFMAVSYYLWHKTAATPLPSSRGEHRQAHL